MPGAVRRGSGALHSVRYNERSQPEVLRVRAPGAPVSRPPPGELAGIAAREGREPTHRQPHRITPTWSAGLRPASRGSAKPAPTTPPPANLTPENPRIANRAESRGAWSAGLRPASRGSAKPAPTTPPPINLTATNPRIANRAESRGHGAPVSDRHRAEARNPHQRPRPPSISRRRTHASPTAQNHVEHGAPVSDRHRAEARNPPQQHRPPPISRLRTHASPTAQNHADMERRSPTGIARERETRTDDPGRANLTAWSAGLRPAPLREAQRKPPKPKPLYGAQQERRSSSRLASLPAGRETPVANPPVAQQRP